MRVRSSVAALIAVFATLTLSSVYLLVAAPQSLTASLPELVSYSVAGFESNGGENSGGTAGTEPVAPEPDFDFLNGFPNGKRIYGVMTADGTDAQLKAFGLNAGRDPNLIAVTAGWADDEYSPWFTERLARKGAMPMISWEPWDASQESTVEQLRSEQPAYALSEILAGEYDDYIDEWADGVAAWGEPVMIRFAHEMNGFWYPWAEERNGNEAGSYVETWRYVHDRFTEAGADNAIWVWSPNVAFAGSLPLDGLYPGDDYVDWVGVVGYFGHFTETPTTHPGFDGIFRKTLDELSSISDKPILVTETGAGPYGPLKAAWITEVMEQFATGPDVEGFVWFNVNKEFDWRVNSSPEALAAFREAVDDPAFAEATDPVVDDGTAGASRRSGSVR